VEKGLISKERAEEINGVSFRAAQLDRNHRALYDNRGGAGDSTIAVAKLSQAIKKAKGVLGKIDSGELKVKPRSLDAPSNKAPGQKSRGSGGSSSRFLWKPVSESNGKLVVLLPSNLSGQIESAAIYSSLPPTEKNVIEKGCFSGDQANGGRAHFRFSKPGGQYPDQAYVVARLKDGTIAKFKIGESSSRNT